MILSGEPTFNGFIKLDDSATWMGMTDQVLKTGHAVASQPPGTYGSMLGAYLAGGEPVGGMLPWGIAHQVVGQDLAWEFQPYMAFLGAMIALAGWSMARPLVRSRPLRALVVFIAAQAALIYGYSLWGGVKEMAAAAILLASLACVIPILEGEARIRTFLPLAAAAFALLGIDGFGRRGLAAGDPARRRLLHAADLAAPGQPEPAHRPRARGARARGVPGH